MISQIALSAKINTLKKFVKSFLTVTACMSEETRRHLKLVGTRPGIMYGPCKVHAECVEGCLPFRQNLPTLQTPTYKHAERPYSMGNLFVLLFLVTPCPVVAAQPCMESIPIKKNIINIK